MSVDHFAGVPYPRPEIWTVTKKDFWSWLTEDGCIICKQPASIHHCIGGSMLTELGVQHGKSQKNSDWLVLPLCYNHHQGREGLHTIGVLTWERRYGSQVSHLDEVNGRLTYCDLFEKAGLPRRKAA